MWHRIALTAAFLMSAPAWAGCPPEGTDAASLRLLKEQKFAVEDTAARDALALGLVDCLSDPDPEIRDGIAYEGITAWLRGDQLAEPVRRQLLERLYAQLDGKDPEGFTHPFAALMLSEVARTDRLQPWLSADERVDMVKRATRYLASVNDYRGYDAKEGWRHGVAHGADWLLQLASNEQVNREQVEQILAALTLQIVPEQAHAYVFGEPGRLARPIIFIARRGVLGDAEWQAWFTGLPQRLGNQDQAYRDVAWLARRHDLIAFLGSLYLEADQSADPKVQALKPAVVAGIKAVP